VPGFANFPGEALALFGAWKPALPFPTWIVVLAAWGALVIGAIYTMRAIRRILHGPLPDKWTGVQDATLWRKVPFVLLLAALLLFGCFPRLLTDKIKPSAEGIVRLVVGDGSPVKSAEATQADAR
jgi:NADH-quinone oxidoreductase subunit M